jgi:hypothetical protein
MIYEIASVASLLRNDIPTQPLEGKGGVGGIEEKVPWEERSDAAISWDCFTLFAMTIQWINNLFNRSL